MADQFATLRSYSPARVIVEFMDGEQRTYELVGGFILSPSLAGDGTHPPTVLNIGYKSSPGAVLEHRATIPLANIRSYRVEGV